MKTWLLLLAAPVLLCGLVAADDVICPITGEPCPVAGCSQDACPVDACKAVDLACRTADLPEDVVRLVEHRDAMRAGVAALTALDDEARTQLVSTARQLVINEPYARATVDVFATLRDCVSSNASAFGNHGACSPASAAPDHRVECMGELLDAQWQLMSGLGITPPELIAAGSEPCPIPACRTACELRCVDDDHVEDCVRTACPSQWSPPSPGQGVETILEVRERMVALDPDVADGNARARSALADAGVDVWFSKTALIDIGKSLDAYGAAVPAAVPADVDLLQQLRNLIAQYVFLYC